MLTRKSWRVRLGIGVTKIILDTNAYSGFMAGDRRVFDYIIESREIFFSTIVLGELFAGFSGETRFQKNKQELKQFLSKSGVQIIDVSTEAGPKLVTFDTHFRHIVGLRLWEHLEI